MAEVRPRPTRKAARYASAAVQYQHRGGRDTAELEQATLEDGLDFEETSTNLLLRAYSSSAAAGRLDAALEVLQGVIKAGRVDVLSRSVCSSSSDCLSSVACQALSCRWRLVHAKYLPGLEIYFWLVDRCSIHFIQALSGQMLIMHAHLPGVKCTRIALTNSLSLLRFEAECSISGCSHLLLLAVQACPPHVVGYVCSTVTEHIHLCSRSKP